MELGIGFGELTFSLLERTERILAFEIEQKLKKYWKEQKEKHPEWNIDIIWGNGVEKFAQYNDQLPNDYKFFSNLPYHITSHVIRSVLESDNKPKKMVLMMQEEVAERICADPGDMSLLSVMVQFFGEVELVRRVSRQAFYPQPKVDSAIIQIDRISNPEINQDKFFRVVKAGFKHKRKQLQKNLKLEFGLEKHQAEQLIAEATTPQYKKARAEKLSLKQWKSLTKKLDQKIQL